jgi:hypothetical protein
MRVSFNYGINAVTFSRKKGTDKPSPPKIDFAKLEKLLKGTKKEKLLALGDLEDRAKNNDHYLKTLRLLAITLDDSDSEIKLQTVTVLGLYDNREKLKVTKETVSFFNELVRKARKDKYITIREKAESIPLIYCCD